VDKSEINVDNVDNSVDLSTFFEGIATKSFVIKEIALPSTLHTLCYGMVTENDPSSPGLFKEGRHIFS